MNEPPIGANRLIAYLLGSLPDDQRTRLEEEYFANDDTFDQLLALEDELIDDYAEGKLSDLERRQFEAYFLNSRQRREKLDFARSLINCVSERADVTFPTASPSRPGAWWKPLIAFLRAEMPAARFALAAGALALVVAGVLITLQNRRLRTELAQTKALQDQLKRESQELREHIANMGPRGGEPEITRLQAPEAPIASLILTSGGTRSSGEQNILVIGSGTPWVRLQLDLDGDEYHGYRVELQTADGSEILRESGLKTQPSGKGYKLIYLWLPSSVFQDDDYIVKLSGMTSSGTSKELSVYAFRTVKQ